MNVRERFEVENKKNKDFFSLRCNLCLSRKIPIKKEKEKNMDRTQTKLNAPQVRYNVKILPK